MGCFPSKSSSRHASGGKRSERSPEKSDGWKSLQLRVTGDGGVDAGGYLSVTSLVHHPHHGLHGWTLTAKKKGGLDVEVVPKVSAGTIKVDVGMVNGASPANTERLAENVHIREYHRACDCKQLEYRLQQYGSPDHKMVQSAAGTQTSY